MKIFNTIQVRAWDAHTIASEPITSIDLMERAAMACVDWLMFNQGDKREYMLFCGTGNNGGDGLAIARILSGSGVPVRVFVCGDPEKGSGDFRERD